MLGYCVKIARNRKDRCWVIPPLILSGIAFLAESLKVEEVKGRLPECQVCSAQTDGVYSVQGKCNSEVSKTRALQNSLQIYIGYCLTKLLTIPKVLPSLFRCLMFYRISPPSTASACFRSIFHDRMIAFSPCCCFRKVLWKMFHTIFFFLFSFFFVCPLGNSGILLSHASWN